MSSGPAFDWNDLKTFLAVARNGSTLAAAKVLGVNQTTVARRLEALESALRLKLVERDQTGSRLSEDGHDLLAAAGRVEQAAEELASRAAARGRGMAETVRLTTVEILSNLIVTPGLAEFRRQYPHIKVDQVLSNDQLDLEAGHADVAIRTAITLEDSDLVARKIADFDFALYASRDYLLRRGLPDSIEDLRNHDLIGDDPGSRPLPAVSVVEGLLPGISYVARCNSLTNLQHALRAGLGVAPFACMVADIDPELVRCLELPGVTASGWVVTTPALKDSPRVRAFIDFMVPYFTASHRALLEKGRLTQDAARASLAAARAAAD